MTVDRPSSPPAIETAPATQAKPAAALRTPTTLAITSDALFAGASEVQISHGGSIYRLKQTALGKLILTK